MFNSIQLNSHGLFSSELRQFFAQKTKLFKIFFCGGGGRVGGRLPHLPAPARASMAGGVLGKSCP